MWPARVKSHSPRQRHRGEAAGLATEAGVPVRSLPGQGRGPPGCNGTGETLGTASSWSVLQRTSRLPGMPSLGEASLSSESWKKTSKRCGKPQKAETIHSPHVCPQPRAGGLPSPARECRIGPAFRTNAFFPQKYGISTPSPHFSEPQPGESRFPLQHWGKTRQAKRAGRGVWYPQEVSGPP